MKEKWKKLRMGAGAMCACTLVLGIVMVAWPSISALTVCIILGIFCLLTGLYEMLRYFKLGAAGVFFRYDLSFGICSMLAGVFLLLHPYGAASLLPIAAGIYILSRSVLDIQTAIEMHRSNVGNWIAVLILGIVDMVFAFFLIFNPFKGATMIMLFIGIALIVTSIRNAYLVYGISKAVKESRSDDVIDVEWKSLD